MGKVIFRALGLDLKNLKYLSWDLRTPFGMFLAT